MRITFRNQVKALRQSLNQYDPLGMENQAQALVQLTKLPLTTGKDLVEYYEALLFMAAYPTDSTRLKRAENELARISRFLNSKTIRHPALHVNSGMPFTPMVTRFTHDQVRWLMAHPHCRITLEKFEEEALELNDVLRLTLPSLERAETTAGLNNTDLMDVLKVPVKGRLEFLVRELSRLDQLPYIKDHLWDSMGVSIRITPIDKTFSIAYNRLPGIVPYYQPSMLKRFDIRGLLDQPVGLPELLSQEGKQTIVRVIKNAMAITDRETDPGTYMDEQSLMVYHLDRGVSVAIYGMIPNRQLPLESYVGYTAFKNGFAVSYGGAWIFGERAQFGINVFETFRNGESAYIMAQLLRLYRQVFEINYFEVEPYQFGLDNPEGIASGAFWFYYRFGFRPLDRELRQLAEKEAGKIAARKGYRTSSKTLIELTGSNIRLKLGQITPPKVADVAVRVTSMIQKKYQGYRMIAEAACREQFIIRTGMALPQDQEEDNVLTEVALWAAAMQIEDQDALLLMRDMIRAKTKDVYAYQTLLLRFFKIISRP